MYVWGVMELFLSSAYFYHFYGKYGSCWRMKCRGDGVPASRFRDFNIDSLNL
uniref:Uncharacterized protein n=1 Tax=Setaria viridis TaxID=4556 RepID=A0A4U6T7Q5_SETVI|nr:hypothetical protein SEVIR_9G198700v2 [Setaria viridis]